MTVTLDLAGRASASTRATLADAGTFQPATSPAAAAAIPATPPAILLAGGALHTPDEEEAAAVLAAVAQYLADEQAALDRLLRKTQEIWQWHGSKVMLTQGVSPIRAPERPAWHNIERLRLAPSGVAGVVGI